MSAFRELEAVLQTIGLLFSFVALAIFIITQGFKKILRIQYLRFALLTAFFGTSYTAISIYGRNAILLLNRCEQLVLGFCFYSFIFWAVSVALVPFIDAYLDRWYFKHLTHKYELALLTAPLLIAVAQMNLFSENHYSKLWQLQMWYFNTEQSSFPYLRVLTLVFIFAINIITFVFLILQEKYASETRSSVSACNVLLMINCALIPSLKNSVNLFTTFRNYRLENSFEMTSFSWLGFGIVIALTTQSSFHLKLIKLLKYKRFLLKVLVQLTTRFCRLNLLGMLLSFQKLHEELMDLRINKIHIQSQADLIERNIHVLSNELIPAETNPDLMTFENGMISSDFQTSKIADINEPDNKTSQIISGEVNNGIFKQENKAENQLIHNHQIMKSCENSRKISKILADKDDTHPGTEDTGGIQKRENFQGHSPNETQLSEDSSKYKTTYKPPSPLVCNLFLNETRCELEKDKLELKRPSQGNLSPVSTPNIINKVCLLTQTYKKTETVIS